MRISIRDTNPIRDFAFLAACVVFAGAAAYFWFRAGSAPLAAGCAVLALIVAGIGWQFSLQRPLLVIDKNGIFDRRLGIGRISWSHIESVQVLGGYGNRVLSLRLRNVETYLARMNAAARRQTREKHDLGFTNFNIDLRDVEVNLLDLQRMIANRIAPRDT